MLLQADQLLQTYSAPVVAVDLLPVSKLGKDRAAHEVCSCSCAALLC